MSDPALPADPPQAPAPTPAPKPDAWMLLRIGATVVVAISLYFAVPLVHAPSYVMALIMIGLVGAAFVAFVLFEFRRILRSERPLLTSVESIILVITGFTTLFAYTYACQSAADPASFSEELGRGDALYFSMTIVTTTGFGDITAVGQMARGVVTVQMALTLGFVAVLVRNLLRQGQRRAATVHGTSPPDDD
ncbi:potassium channel family protein [Serinibacter salmoneus]|uniref:Ion channel n=1 Tax=Serinibacter salmoneus TaxID=556530 RepID=A0A2A9CYK9_9MICO|nr:potassium channel family protein [Serinibacter salmoneus]PFG19483.1 ion channel [Serinibacter salmoneus]